MGIEIHEIIRTIEEIEIEEIVGMKGPITEMIDEIIEVGEIAMIEIEVEDIAETIIIETEDLVQHIAMDHGVQEVLQEGEIIAVTIGIDMTSIEDDLVKAREERKKGIITKTVIRRVTTLDLSSHENGLHTTKMGK